MSTYFAKYARAREGGGEFTLTDGIDVLTGTTGDDLFVGDSGTISAADSISGDAGTDRANLFLDGADEAITAEGVENFFIQASGAARAFGTGNVEGIQQVWNNNSSQDLTINGLSEAATVGVRGGGGNDYTVNFADSLASGTADSATIALENDANLTNLQVSGTTDTNEFETITVSNSGDSVVTDLQDTGGNSLAGLETLTVNGSGTLEIGTALGTGQDLTVDSSSGSVGVDVILQGGDDTFTGGSGADSVTTGAGNDSVTAGAGNDTVLFAGNLTADDSADGGDGTDTVGIADGADLSSDAGDQLSNFEVLDIANGTGTYDLSNLSGITSVTNSAATSGTAVTLNNVAEDTSLDIGANLGNTLTLNQAGAGAGSPNDTIDVSLEADADITTGSAFQVPDVETVNITSNSDESGVTHTVTDATLDNTTLIDVGDGSANLTFADLQAASLVLFDGSDASNSISLTSTDDFSGVTGGTAFQGGADADTIDMSGAAVSAGTQYQGNGGGDNITLDAPGDTISETVVYGSSDDSALSDLDTITNFDTAGAATDDDIDVSGLSLSTNTSSVFDKGDIDGDTAFNTDADVTDFFDESGTDRAIAIENDGTDSRVYVDTNGNGDFDVDSDLTVEVAGVTNLDINDFIVS